MRRSIATLLVFSVAISGCAQTHWHREDGAPALMESDAADCKRYIEEEEGIVAVNVDGTVGFNAHGGTSEAIRNNIRAQQGVHQKLAAWRDTRLTARHAALLRGNHVVRTNGHSGNNAAAAELAAVAAVLLIAVIASSAQRSAAFNECMAAQGWMPGDAPLPPTAPTPDPAPKAS